MGSNKIREARRAKGWTQAQLAERMGVSQQAIQRYETGKRNLRGDTLRNLSKSLGVTVAYLLGMATPDDYTAVPLFNSIEDDTPLEMESADGSRVIPGEVHTRWPEAFLLHVEDESMNRILPNGSYALVNPCTAIEYDGQPYVLRMGDDAATIKRVHMTDGGCELRPDSTDPDFQPIVLHDDELGAEALSIIGRVVWHCIPAEWSY